MSGGRIKCIILRASIFKLRYIVFLEKLNMQFFHIEIMCIFLIQEGVFYRTQTFYPWSKNDTMGKIKFVT